MRSTCLALATLLLCSCTPDLRNVNWSTYLGDPGRSHYSELVQINRDNVHELDVAWVYDSGELVPGSRPVMYTSPLVIDGVLYGLSPRLIALDPSTGQPVEDFGENGRLDLTPSGRSTPFFVSVPGSATPDFYGGSRAGDNLFANCLLALDARTGELRWYFQAVRHDLWDRDLPSPPTLVQVERSGAVIDAVAVTTKSGHLFLFDRDTGESLYDIAEVPTPPSDLPGEQASLTQPMSSVAFTRQSFEITTRSQEATDFVKDLIKDLDQRPWAPPTEAGTLFYPAYDGGAEWGGSAFDPNSNRLILNAQEIGGIIRLHEIPVGFNNRYAYVEHCASCFGDYPETEGLGLGAENYGGPVVTASGLIFIGATGC